MKSDFSVTTIPIDRHLLPEGTGKKAIPPSIPELNHDSLCVPYYVASKLSPFCVNKPQLDGGGTHL